MKNGIRSIILMYERVNFGISST